jgi:ABC-type nickel/cobalt efflux system permease component RcnA
MDDFAVVTVSEAVVTVYTAKSQSMRAMGKKAFAESKEAVLRILSEMLGVEVGQLPTQEAA